MKKKKEDNTKKQLDLLYWLNLERSIKKTNLNKNLKKEIKKENNSMPKLAFGYGYNPEILKNGITKFALSHTLKNGLNLYEFEPKLPYRIFNELSKIMKYKYIGNELRKNNTHINSRYFTTDRNPKEIIKDLNFGIKRLFEIYEMLPKYDTN